MSKWSKPRSRQAEIEPGSPLSLSAGEKIICSPLSVQAGRQYKIFVDLQLLQNTVYVALEQTRLGLPPRTVKRLYGISNPGVPLVFSYAATGNAKLHINITAGADGCVIKPGLVRVESKPFDAAFSDDTALPHWGRGQRMLHNICKNNRFINAFIASLEMRMNREECVSVPMYMAVSPTGRCNANCIFCSVGPGRDGIVQKDADLSRLLALLAPASKSMFLLGLEGNGEPTVSRHFFPLLDSMSGTPLYLITNGAQLTPDKVMEIIGSGIVACNFSLNAASEATYQKVMHLKNLQKTLDAVRLMRDWYDKNFSVSFVVNRHNAHEMLDFLLLADQDLQPTEIFIHPLSELANSSGTFEDTRDIVPYTSDIKDVIDAVEEFKSRYWSGKTIIHFEPDNFRSFRKPEKDGQPRPYGLEDQILPPWPKYWHSNDDITWGHNSLSFNTKEPKVVAVSELVLVNSDKGYSFTYSARGAGSADIQLQSANGEVLGRGELVAGEKQTINLPGGYVEAVRIVITSNDIASQWRIDFLRFASPHDALPKELKLPVSRRWEVHSPQFRVQWQASRVLLSGKPQKAAYILKSYTISIPANHENVSLNLDVKINSGQPIMGVLDALSNTWHQKFELENGRRDYTLELGGISGIQLVFYSANESPLDFSVDFGSLMEASDNFVIEPVKQVSAASVEEPEDSAPKAGKKQKYYYCQKPWTDMSNFTVDGRMDVCCIATGGSQQEFALGNFFNDDFQSMWNGPAMRRFRRTVNSDNKLGPCRRCPMSYNYGGIFFHARNTTYALLYPLMQMIPSHKWKSFLQVKALPRLLKVIKPLFFKKFKPDGQ